MSRRIEWTTTEGLSWAIHDRGERLAGYDEPVTAQVGLFLGNGGDGLVIEGPVSALVEQLRALADHLERHTPSAYCTHCGALITERDPDDGKGAGWLDETGARFCDDDDSGDQHEPA
jgi:hypothetical protein